MLLASVMKSTNPKSKNYGTWYVVVCQNLHTPMEEVFRSESKKKCIEYAKALCENVHISNGVDYGAKF